MADEFWRDMREHFNDVKDKAFAKRVPEIQAVRDAGYPVTINGVQWKVGPLNIYPTTGRWWNELTKKRGRLNHKPILSLVEEQWNAVKPTGLEREA